MKKFLITLAVILALVVVAEVGFLVYRDSAADSTEPTTVPTTAATTEAPTTQAPTEVTTEATQEPTTVPTTEAPTEVPTTAATEAPTEVPTEAETEPATEPVAGDGSTTYLLSFAGNCTLGSPSADAKNSASFISVIGDNYSLPFSNVAEYFKNDDFTMVNLEGVLADSGDAINKSYTFIGPSAYTKILTEGGVDAVSLANDHTGDFGKTGYADTKTNLEAAGVSYVEKDSSLLYTTDSGLTIGIYAVNSTLSNWDMQQDIRALKNKGAEIIVVYFHWGDEKAYAPNLTQINYAHAAVNAGADLVIGTGPHVLQKVESYKSGMICYSLGNFSYGGTKWPSDMDTAFVQLKVTRDKSGKVAVSDLYIIPCAMSSTSSQNNFQPIILEADNWQFKQIMRKVNNASAADTQYTPSTETTASTGSSNAATTAPVETPVEPTTAPTEATTEATTAPGPDYDSNDVPDKDDPQA